MAAEKDLDIEDIQLLTQLGMCLNRRLRDETAEPSDVRALTVRDFLVESLLKVRSKARGLIHLKPNRAQREYGDHCSRRNVVLKARQLGITTYVAARFFVQTITQPGTMTVQVAHDQESAEQIFRIVHRFWENMPLQLRQGALQTSRANIRQIVFSRLDSEYRVATAADANPGRGMTIHHLHCSEVARWPGDAGETLASLRAAVPENGEVVLESTPNGAGGVFYEEWQNAAETGYTQHFFPWWYEEHYQVDAIKTRVQPLTEEERSLVARAGLSDAQIAWRRLKRGQLRGGLAAQEYAEDPVSCFRASGECVFELDAIERALQACGRPTRISDNARMTVWFPAQRERDYVIGVDPAGGGSDGDYSCATVVDRKSGLQCAELHGHFPPREFSGKLVELAHQYKGGMLAVERNNHGYGVLAHLQMSGYANIFSQGGQPGWLTSAATRPAMIENLASVLATDPGLFNSHRLLNECRTFVRHADGSTGAATGAHDDCVMAMAIALAARQAISGKSYRRGGRDLADPQIYPGSCSGNYVHPSHSTEGRQP